MNYKEAEFALAIRGFKEIISQTNSGIFVASKWKNHIEKVIINVLLLLKLMIQF